MADPSGIILRTSGRCQADYGTYGYDLRTILRGERVAERCEDFRRWVELAVIAHLMGRPTKRMPQDTVQQIEDEQLTVLNAALAYAVDEAVAARSAASHDRFSPADFAGHVARQLQLHLWAGCSTDPCATAEPNWTATPFRANLVLDQLAAHARHSTARHPRTRYWEITYGIRLDGGTAAEQLHNAQWAWATRHSLRQVHGILLGEAAAPPPAAGADELVAGTLEAFPFEPPLGVVPRRLTS